MIFSSKKLLKQAVLFMSLVAIYIPAYSKKVDSLLQLDVSPLNDTQQIQYYINLSREYIPLGESAKGIAAISKGYKIAQKLDNKIWQAKCELFMGANYMDAQPDSALLMNTLALDKFEKARHSWRIYCLENLSNLYRLKSMFSDALNIRRRIINYHLEKKDTIAAGDALTNYGFIFDKMRNYEMAIEQYRKVVSWAKDISDTALYGRAMGYIGIAKDELGEYDSAHYYNFIALDIYKLVDDDWGIRPWYSNIANTYMKEKKWANAEKYMQLSLAGLNYDNETTKLSNLGKIYANTGRYKQAEKLLLLSVKNSTRYNGLGDLSESYLFLHELYVLLDKPKKALEYHVKHKKIEDSITARNKQFQVDVSKLTEDTARQEKELNKASSLIKNRNVLIGLLGALLLTIILLTLYIVKKQRQKRQEEKMAHLQKLREEKERISRDLHDNIGSQLTFLIAGTDKEQLKELNQFARDTLDQLRNTVWAIKKNKIEVDDFDIELSSYINKLKGKTTVDLIYHSKIENNFVLPPTVAINIFRALQEALSNAIKHAEASQINITLEASNKLILKVIDNGKGIEKNGLHGHGLSFMKQRLEEIHGSIEIVNLNPGTKIIMLINPQILD